MPDRVSSRIALAFATVGLVATLAVGAGLFVSLRQLHRDETISTLGDIAQPVAARVRLAGAVSELRAELAAIAPTTRAELGVYAVTGRRVVAAQVGAAAVDVAAIPIDSSLAPGVATGGDTTALDGSRVLYAVTVVRAQAALTAPVAIVLTTPDRSAALALRDLLRVLPIVLLVTGAIALPIAWLLSRSITRPLRRLASATAALPASASAPVPVEGPREIRELTDRFNDTTGELERVRAEERELLANVRHDLRTPLTVVAGFAEALRDGTASGDQVRRAGDAIAQEAARMERLVDDLRSVDELRAGKVGLRPESLDPAALVEAAAERFAQKAGAAGIDVSAAADPGLGLVADRTAVERILGNLVENAIANGRPGGHVLIEARGAGERSIALRVSDDGPGFPAGTLERVFDRFYRADPSRTGGGSGLGLSIVRALAAAHGGRATAENLAPTGARITVLLPASPPGPGPAVGTESPAEARSASPTP
jgi:signal transduction histidine kinase